MTKISPIPLNNIMKYVIHYIGEWTHNPDGYSDPTFSPGWTKEFNNLNDIELFHRQFIDQMIKDDEKVLHTGVHVYQILQ